ncbi:hypothetical protein NDS46_24195 [Paenibacillus thiaminolyticus]|nr:hypothetical protein [Paenibacillus thiaminolyticus]WCF07389.1 hypothetical protein NDS46_24195 [Paenibacillus thiaminolyticus]
MAIFRYSFETSSATMVLANHMGSGKPVHAAVPLVAVRLRKALSW